MNAEIHMDKPYVNPLFHFGCRFIIQIGFPPNFSRLSLTACFILFYTIIYTKTTEKQRQRKETNQFLVIWTPNVKIKYLLILLIFKQKKKIKNLKDLKETTLATIILIFFFFSSHVWDRSFPFHFSLSYERLNSP